MNLFTIDPKTLEKKLESFAKEKHFSENMAFLEINFELFNFFSEIVKPFICLHPVYDYSKKKSSLHFCLFQDEKRRRFVDETFKLASISWDLALVEEKKRRFMKIKVFHFTYSEEKIHDPKVRLRLLV